MWTRFFNLYSRFTLCLWGGLAASIFIFNTLQFDLYIHLLSTVTVRFVVPILFASMFFFMLRLNANTRLAIANTLTAIMIALYAGEFYLAVQMESVRHDAAAAPGAEFDARNKLTVIKDLRGKGVNAFPVMRAANMLADQNGVLQPVLSSQGSGLLPMASIPDTTVVSCNETGKWQIYVSDRHGFNNPDSEWNVPHPKIGIVGDSFAHGSCVPSEQNIAAGLRTKFGNAINLGVGGFGPLLELAALTEYLEPLKPAKVLWVFYEGNDLTDDLPYESRSPLLETYLKDDKFSQHLMARRSEIADSMRSFMKKDLVSAMERVDGPLEGLVRFASLDRMRERIGLGAVQIGFNLGELDAELKLFHEIIVKARDRVAAWNGQLYLVYLPESARYLSVFGTGTLRQEIYHGVNDIVAREGIPLIDISKVFADTGAPESLYVYPGSHFNAEGYRVAADAIASVLEAAPGGSAGGKQARHPVQPTNGGGPEAITPPPAHTMKGS